MAITPSDFSKIWASNADTPEYTFSEADYLKGWDFVGNLPPTRAQWNAMQKSTDEKMKYVFDNFGAPLTASTVAEMTLQNRVYVYTGSETGYTAGHWYYWNGSAWTDGGVYNSVAFSTDTTLTISGAAADAKATGDAIKSTKAEMSLFGIDDLLWDNTNPASKTQNGITFTVDKINKTVTIRGTATGGNAALTFFVAGSIPSWLQVNKKYYVHMQNDTDADLRVSRKINGTWNYSFMTRGVTELILDSSVTDISIEIVVWNGTTINTVVRPFISEAYSLSELKEIQNKSITNVGTIPDGDLNELSGNIVGLLASSHTYINLPFSGFGGTIYNIETTSISTTQLAIGFSTGVIYYRKKTSTLTPQWIDWVKVTGYENEMLRIRDMLPENTDLNTIADNSVYGLQYGTIYNNLPIGVVSIAGFVSTYRIAPTLQFQTIHATYPHGKQYIRQGVRGIWGEWFETGKGKYAASKKYVAFGDSLTWGAVWPATQGEQLYRATEKYRIPTRIALATGLIDNFVNEGVGGTGYVHTSGGQTITSKILNYDFTGVELVTIMGGANDCDGVVELGTHEATAGDGTICGAIKSIIDYIKTNYPKTQVVFIQMTPVGSSADSWGTVYYGKWSLNTYDAEVSQLCHNNHVGYVNWWESLYVDTWIQHGGGYNGNIGPNYSHPKVEEDYALLGDFIGGKNIGIMQGFKLVTKKDKVTSTIVNEYIETYKKALTSVSALSL